MKNTKNESIRYAAEIKEFVAGPHSKDFIKAIKKSIKDRTFFNRTKNEQG